MFSDTSAGLTSGPILGGPLEGMEPSVVYHICALVVTSLMVNRAALSPATTGLATLNWNVAWTIGLLGRPAWKLMALTVTSGMIGSKIESGTSLWNMLS